MIFGKASLCVRIPQEPGATNDTYREPSLPFPFGNRHHGAHLNTAAHVTRERFNGYGGFAALL